jgi:ubiquitin C-terminal hydrolase
MKLYSFFNLGNTCYLNSVLQCFINDPCFKTECNNQSILFTLLDTIKIDFTVNDENINHRYNIIDIVNYFHDKFRRFQQHDAHEFLLEFLENINNKIYYGKTKTCVTCTSCKNVSDTFEDFSTINLHIGHENLIDTFIDYLKKEEIHDYRCEKCNLNVKAEKKSYLWTLNSRLILVLKRYSVKQKIKFPFNNLKIRETESGIIFNYELYAVIYHYGNTENGHYNCDVKINGNWYFIDDDTINLNNNIDNNNSNNNNNSYILFYKKNNE